METSEQKMPTAETERMMKIQEVILKAMAGQLKWWEAAEIIGVTDRTMRRWRERYQEHGYTAEDPGQPSCLQDRRPLRRSLLPGPAAIIGVHAAQIVPKGFLFGARMQVHAVGLTT